MLNIYFTLAASLAVCIFWLLPDRLRNTFLTLAGAVAFASVDSVACVTFFAMFGFVSFCIRRLPGAKTRRLWFWIATVGCILPLLILKLNGNVLPLGISYFSLTMLGLFYDFYRKSIAANTSLVSQFFFAGYFPLTPIGPIERFPRLTRTLLAPKTWNSSRASEGAFLISLGLFKKFVIADRISPMITDPGRAYMRYEGPELWLFLAAALIQIFCDFSGAIDIVRGFSKILGVEVIDNFNQPYFSRSIPDIWRRWHISLVDWLRDFVYNPIALRTRNLYFASAVVMLLVGFWHDISWNRLVWAAYWSALFSASIFLRRSRVRRRLPALAGISASLVAMVFSSIFFLPRNFNEATALLAQLFHFVPSGFSRLEEIFRAPTSELSIAISAFFLVVLFETLHRRLTSEYRTLSFAFFLVSFCVLFFATVVGAVGDSIPFIYLRF